MYFLNVFFMEMYRDQNFYVDIKNELYLHEMNWVIFHLSRLIARFAFKDSYDNFQNEGRKNHELDFFGTSRYKYFQCLC